MSKVKVIVVAGARPNFMKIAPILRALKDNSDAFEYKLVHTGQHYDYKMNEVFFHDLGIPSPHYLLNVGSGTHAQQTARIMVRFEKVCIQQMPNLVMVVGDVNSTLACSITAKKMAIGVAHVEAGLRSFDRMMPEEINRVITDSIADYSFITEESGYANLIKEGHKKNKLFFVGNVMVDNLFYELKKISYGNFLFKTDKLKKTLNRYACLTLHRPSNVDNEVPLRELMYYLGEISKKIPIIFPIHPRTKKNLKKFVIPLSGKIISLPPLSYREFLNLWKDSMCVFTDSGGIQEETTALGIPCFTLRENTERPVTVKEGTNILIDNDYGRLVKEVNNLLKGKMKNWKRPRLWDGRASERIVNILRRLYN